MYLSQKILDVTDGGRQIIEDYYEASKKGFNSPGNKEAFCIRDESTPSALVRREKNGTWIVTDFGDDQKGRNGITVYMKEEGVDFVEAITALAKKYGLSENYEKPKAKVDYKTPTKKEVPGTQYEFNDQLTDTELNILGPEVTQDICKKFNLKSCKKYTLITPSKKEPNKLLKIVVESTPEYPIFVFDLPDFKKKYEPLNADKGRRFTHSGTRPLNYVFGLDNLRKLYQDNRQNVIDNWEKLDKPTENDFKLEAVILGSGERDSLNISSFDYPVIWLNSETDKLTWETYLEILKMTKNFYLLPDIDKTGKEKGVEKALNFPELKIIWLPKWLAYRKDFRGKPRKDFRDFVQTQYYKGNEKTFKGLLKKMVKNALPMRFWDEKWKKSRATDEWYCKYEFNKTYADHFIEHMGFFLYKDIESKEKFQFIKKTNHVIEEVEGFEIKKYLLEFLEKKNHDIDLRNMLQKTTQLSDINLSTLNAFAPNFKKGYIDSQYLFFKDKTWHITKDDIKIYDKNKEFYTNVWKSDIIDFSPKLKPAPFKITGDLNSGFSLEILEKENKYQNYLINSSRLFWKEELETPFKSENGFKQTEKQTYFEANKFNIAGENLSKEEIAKQELNLINKYFANGYLLHSYKNDVKSWFVRNMDNEESVDQESNGGTGKSLFFKMLSPILKNIKKIDGREKNVSEKDFLLDGVTSKTDLVLIEDMDLYFRLHRLLNFVTDQMNVNRKGVSEYSIKFDDSAKLGGTSNFGVRNLDPTLLRRLLFVITSNYYHEKGDRFNETRQVSDDFNGKRLLKDFTDEDWNDYYTLCAYMIQFFLQQDKKIDPPLDSVNKRNNESNIKRPFKDWADMFFNEGNNTNVEVNKNDAYKAFKEDQSQPKFTSHAFKTNLKAYCKSMDYVFNPEDYGGVKDGRIMRKENGKTQEFFFIKTNKNAVIETSVYLEDDKSSQENNDIDF